MELSVITSAGVLPGGVQPASLSAGATTLLTFPPLPLNGGWIIAANGVEQVSRDVLNPNIDKCTTGTVEIELGHDGVTSVHCLDVR